jgi:HlyD family secretion protein
MTKIKKISIFLILFIIAFLSGYLFYTNNHAENKINELVLFGNVDVRLVDLGFRVKGRIDKLMFEEGDLVPKGSLMATLDKQPYEDLVKEAEAALNARVVEFENSEVILNRRFDLLEDGGVSEEEYQNALFSKDLKLANIKAAKASLGVAKTNYFDTEIFAPIDGTILTRIKEPGSVIREADPVYTLTITDPVWVRAYVTEGNLGRIYAGMRAYIYTDTDSLPIYSGHIGFISPISEFTPKTVETMELRADLVYRLRIIVDNPDHFLKQGMPVTVKLPLKEDTRE